MKTKLQLGIVIPISKKYSFSLLLLMLSIGVWGQTTLISPTVNNGGFETDLTGWTTVQSGVGRGAWYSGTATFYDGSKSAYISNDGGVTNAYTGNQERIQHLYRAITFPAGETIINLSFYWKASGESSTFDYDNLKVFVSNTLPTAGTANSSADRVGLNWYNLQTTWQNASVTLPTSLAGTTRYLIFQWKHDGSTTNNPPAAIDNITLTSQAPPLCSGTPTAGTVTVAPSSGSSGSTYGVTATGYSTGSGLTYQWQYSDNGSTWINQGTATSSYVALTGLTAPAFGVVRTWRLVVTCTASSSSANSGTGTFTSTYCTPTSSNTSDYISGFSTTGGVSNISNTPTFLSGSGYGNFYTTYSASQYAGSTLNFTETYQGGSHGLSIWVDFNNNGIFETSERLYNATSLATNFSGTITIPAATVAGNYRMRVRAWWNNLNPDPCSNIAYGEAEDYRLTVLTLPPCSGTPNAGTALVNGVANASASVNASITLSASGLTTGSGLSYQWYSSANGSTWTPISGAVTSTYTTTAVATETTTYYRLVTTCANGGATNTSSNATVVTSLAYCVPSTESPSWTYINRVSFLGTLNDVTNTSTYSSSPAGYQNFTGLANKAIQIQQEAINVYVQSNYGSRIKAWVDWNKDGDFTDTGEEIFDSVIGLTSTTFGFVVPASAAAGDYRIRIRNYTYYDGWDYAYDYDFSPCEPFLDSLDEEGEAEDYLFTLVTRCLADIETVTKGERCGTGSVILQASTVSSGITEFRWYTSATGGTPLTSANVSGSTTFNTPSISATTTYYVAAFNGTCETQIRRAVVATVKEVPDVTFSPASPVACGDSTPIEVSADDDLETVYLVDENFDVGNLGASAFANTNIVNNGGSINQISRWESKASPFVPVDGEDSWVPAISSGYGTDKFVFSNSDVGPGYTIDHGLVLRNSINTTDFQNLTMKFRMYFSRYNNDGVGPTAEYVSVEVSTNGGTTYTSLATPRVYTSDVGTPGNFATETVDLSAYINQTDLKFRIRYYSNGWRDGVAVDDIQIYGSKTLEASYSWSGSDISVFTDAAMNTPYVAGTSIDRVYIVPNLSLLVQPSFDINVTSTLTNGCPLVKTIPVTNNSKVWDGTNTAFNDPNNWKPIGIPNNTNCVIIPDTGFEPVIPAAYDGVAKTISVKPNAQLTISSGSSITVTDEVLISNNNTPSNLLDDGKVLIENTGSLVQVNNPPLDISGNSVNNNIGTIEMKRITTPMYRYDFTYWSSPVEESPSFTLNTLSPNTLPDKYFRWNALTQNWQTLMNGASAMDEGIGYIVRAPQSYAIEGQAGATPQAYTATFTGKPNNGIITVNVVGGTDKWNLIGNPYPSAIEARDFILHPSNANLDGTLYFWTHNSPPAAATPGASTYDYSSDDYATYNLTGATATAVSLPADSGTGSGNNNNAPDGSIPAGQSFFVQGLSDGDAVFSNTMRTTGPNSNFYRQQNNTTEGRVWINLIKGTRFHQTLIGYIDQATNGQDRGFDGKLMGGSSANISSLIGTEKYIIQGRSLPFDIMDEVPLNVSFVTAGNYKIAIDHFDGFFNTQDIFLKDNSLNVIHNLKTAPYEFTTANGNFNNRFVLVYRNSSLDKPHFDLAENQVYVLNQSEKLLVKSIEENLKTVVVYDLLGREILRATDIQNKEYLITGLLATEQTLLIQIELENGMKTTKKAMVVK
ncbi:T9SS sorting signal type C domain-containing protein [Flavobacterium sp. NST-5]|uniref:T9SS sorting signal type C domain-containing protein n=1 Tax=Flavobacterium ichthyis TaxID=2698827 RepID=A0ABW9Z764_9FLAO|nr:GEVED domain-containing protein [Flavobacterium ichthyis]NBL64690.1 T9SS sorting signal type C domain-containing protein [Flavobacterium ichthyis]